MAGRGELTTCKPIFSNMSITKQNENDVRIAEDTRPTRIYGQL